MLYSGSIFPSKENPAGSTGAEMENQYININATKIKKGIRLF